MKNKTEHKRAAVAYTFDRNGALVVNQFSLLTSGIVRDQISAAIKYGHALKERARGSAGASAVRTSRNK
jgi:hypothetical protein